MLLLLGHVSSFSRSLYINFNDTVKFIFHYTEYLKHCALRLQCWLCLVNANKSCTRSPLSCYFPVCKCHNFVSNNKIYLLNTYSETIFLPLKWEINAVRWPHQPHSWFGDIFDYHRYICVCVCLCSSVNICATCKLCVYPTCKQNQNMVYKCACQITLTFSLYRAFSKCYLWVVNNSFSVARR